MIWYDPLVGMMGTSNQVGHTVESSPLSSPWIQQCKVFKNPSGWPLKINISSEFDSFSCDRVYCGSYGESADKWHSPIRHALYATHSPNKVISWHGWLLKGKRTQFRHYGTISLALLTKSLYTTYAPSEARSSSHPSALIRPCVRPSERAPVRPVPSKPHPCALETVYPFSSTQLFVHYPPAATHYLFAASHYHHAATDSSHAVTHSPHPKCITHLLPTSTHWYSRHRRTC